MHAILALLLALVPLAGTLSDEGRGGGRLSVSPGEPLAEGAPYPGGFFGQAETDVVSVENFRFCRRGCRADSVAYVRAAGKPFDSSCDRDQGETRDAEAA